MVIRLDKNTASNTRQAQYICPVESCSIAHSNIKVPDLIINVNYVNIPIGNLHDIPDSVKYGIKNNLCYAYFKYISPDYKVVENLGINHKNAKVVDICLAKYAKKVADTMRVASTCYTGTKHALWSSGVITDYKDMPKGSAHKAIEYFDKYPEKFVKLDVAAQDLKNLPAGVIIVYHKEGTNGHIAITNGYGQEMSDSTDNMEWLKKHGENASFSAYKLSDKWKYNSDTMKLEFSE